MFYKLGCILAIPHLVFVLKTVQVHKSATVTGLLLMLNRELAIIENMTKHVTII
jgi:hypothetical protein